MRTAGRTETVAVQCGCPAKVNLNLIIVGRRSDGYHLIESEMAPIGIYDTVQLRVSPGASRVDLTATGRTVPSGDTNLVVRATHLYLKRTGRSARVEVRLIKRIPVGAGLGGGSSDAAAVLRALDHAFGHEVGTVGLREWALDLGADVPFFVSGVPAIISGIGEKSRTLSTWPTAPLVVAFRGGGLATADVYARFDAPLTSREAASTISAFPPSLLLPGRNDLEGAACQIEPEIQKLKYDFVLHGASDVRMSGSGSAVFGFFDDEGTARICAQRLAMDGGWAEATKILDGPVPIERLDDRLR
jgi:4-diphosphocytidyl-2-C-methyl-D-erythritol kinase